MQSVSNVLEPPLFFLKGFNAAPLERKSTHTPQEIAENAQIQLASGYYKTKTKLDSKVRLES